MPESTGGWGGKISGWVARETRVFCEDGCEVPIGFGEVLQLSQEALDGRFRGALVIGKVIGSLMNLTACQGHLTKKEHIETKGQDDQHGEQSVQHLAQVFQVLLKPAEGRRFGGRWRRTSGDGRLGVHGGGGWV